MTEFAYHVHDRLVDLEGIDPNSARYYHELDKRIYAKFPDRAPKPPAARSGNGSPTRDRPAAATYGGSKLGSHPHQPRQAWNAKQRGVQPDVHALYGGTGSGSGGKAKQAWVDISVGAGAGTALGGGSAYGASGSSEYARTRALIMQELKQAKADAEAERKRLMREIGQRLNQRGAARAGWQS